MHLYKSIVCVLLLLLSFYTILILLLKQKGENRSDFNAYFSIYIPAQVCYTHIFYLSGMVVQC